MGNIVSSYLCPHPPIIINKIGKGREKKVKDTLESLNLVAKDIKEKSPTTIIVITPHGPVFRDAIAINYQKTLSGDLRKFGCSEVSNIKENNIKLVDKILKKSKARDINTVKLDKESTRMYRNITLDLDHGVQVPLHFIDQEYNNYKLVHITYGLLGSEELYNFGRAIKNAVKETDERVVIIASGDLSHKLTEDGPYGYDPSGPKFDRLLTNFIKNKKYEEIINLDKNLAKKAGECGLNSINIMLGALDGYETVPTVLSYEGTFGVGYAVAKFDIKGENNKSLLEKINSEAKEKMKRLRDDEDSYVKLARKSLEYFIKKGKRINLDNEIPEEMIEKKAGTFVSIKKNGNLRGCIGTILPTKKNIANEIIDNAIKAGTEDPRFYSIQENELKNLVYSVDILGKPEKVNSIDDLDINRYGVIVTSGRKRGLLLPNLEGVNSVKEQLNIVLRKANISPNEDYTIERFEVIRHN
ncbi:MAG: AmmeMemoRadiSam system protein A [Firmicutes bacterium]|nr:AmmeMemoRadiSam system protein A [Bacillota bacterium]